MSNSDLSLIGPVCFLGTRKCGANPSSGRYHYWVAPRRVGIPFEIWSTFCRGSRAWQTGSRGDPDWPFWRAP